MIFIAMGMIDSTGPMVSLARESFKISNTVASFLPMLGYLMFGILSVPMGLLQDRKGKKYILKIGLTICLMGLVIPIFSGMYGKMVIHSGSMMQFYLILAAILLLGAGAAILQVSGNPIMRDISDEGKYSKNLSLAQSFITIGSSMGFLLPIIAFHAFGLDWSVLFPFFSILVLINLLLFNSVKIKEKVYDDEKHATFRSCLRLLKKRYVLMMVMGIFVYCGVEIAMSSHVPTLLREKYGVSVEKEGLLIIWLLFYLQIMLGRFFGSLILSKVAPKLLLVVTSLVSLCGIILIFQNSYVLTLTGIFLAGLGFANICPLIFSMTIDRMPEHTNELSGLMVSAIAGGAVIPPLTGMVADLTSIRAAFVVPLVCLVYILIVSVINFRKTVEKVNGELQVAELQCVKSTIQNK